MASAIETARRIATKEPHQFTRLMHNLRATGGEHGTALANALEAELGSERPADGARRDAQHEVTDEQRQQENLQGT